MYRKTYVEIDLAALAHNYHVAKQHVGKDVAILVPVKSDAYGHGIVEVSRLLESIGVNYIGVGTMDEAVGLRQAGIKAPILLLGSTLPEEVSAACQYQITLSASSGLQLEYFDRIACEKKARLLVHIEIDTGMSRLGMRVEEAMVFFNHSLCYKNIIIEGIFTHFHSADDPDETFTRMQMKKFNVFLDHIKAKGIAVQYVHAANSSGLMHFRDSYFNLVRPGLMIYGLYPDQRCLRQYYPDPLAHSVSTHTSLSAGLYSSDKTPSLEGASPEGFRLRAVDQGAGGFPSGLYVKPVLSFKSRVVLVKNILRGETVSYGHAYTAARDMRLAVVCVGYGDGYGRGLSQKAEVLLGGTRAKVIGHVCMDLIMVDVSSIGQVNPGDEVVLIGKQGSQQIRAEELAWLSNTIPYEITCLISKRVPRVYKEYTNQERKEVVAKHGEGGQLFPR